MMRTPFFKHLKDSLTHFFYPAYCLHCGEPLPPNQGVCCHVCHSFFEILDPKERCMSCFCEIEGFAQKKCPSCQLKPSPFFRCGAVFDYNGPPASAIQRLKYSNQPYLAKGLGAFMVTQFEQLRWPLPDAIVPVPLSFTHWLRRGYNQSFLIAEEMGKMLSVPVWDILMRRSGDYSQARLRLAQRNRLSESSIQLKKKVQIQDKTLLVIDDVRTSGSTLNRCGEALLEGLPNQLYALVACQTPLPNK